MSIIVTDCFRDFAPSVGADLVGVVAGLLVLVLAGPHVDLAVLPVLGVLEALRVEKLFAIGFLLLGLVIGDTFVLEYKPLGLLLIL